jgi:hypothetical protein
VARNIPPHAQPGRFRGCTPRRRLPNHAYCSPRGVTADTRAPAISPLAAAPAVPAAGLAAQDTSPAETVVYAYAERETLPPERRIAIKVIDFRGNEAIRVLELP